MEFKWNKSVNQLVTARGLNDGGRTQMYIDSEVLRLMKPYTPILSGALIRSATISTVIGSGDIKQNAPYARYQYHGKLMVSRITGSAYARMGESKVLTDKNLKYRKINPNAGPFWFERMKSDYKRSILNGAKKVSGAK